MFSQATQYSLRAVLLLALRPGVPQTTQQIADAVRIPCGYLAKVLQVLVRAGIITSQRGVGGGFVLGMDPAGLTLMDVVRAVETSPRVPPCRLGTRRNEVSLCSLHRRLDAAVVAAERELGATTIAELAAENEHSQGGVPTTRSLAH